MVRHDNIRYDIKKNNKNIIKKIWHDIDIWICEYIKIIWIKKNMCQDLYNTLNMIWEKYEYDKNTCESLFKVLV